MSLLDHPAPFRRIFARLWNTSGSKPSEANQEPSKRLGEDAGAADYLVMALLGTLALAVYLKTLSAGVYPGLSAVSTANALGVLPLESSASPVWLSVFRGLAQIPWSSPAYAFNVANALLAAFAVAWTYLVVRRISFLAIRPTPAWRMVPVDSSESTEKDPSDSSYFLQLTPDQEKVTAERVAATLGGVVAAAAFAFSAPFWRAATSLHAYPFDVLIALIAADLLVRYAQSDRLGPGVMAFFLFGLLAIEWPLFLVLTPLIAGGFIYFSARRQQLTESVLLLMLLSGLSGLTASLGAALLSGAHSGATTIGFAKNVYDAVVFHFRMATAITHRPFGLFTVCIPLVALLFSVKGCAVLKQITDLATRWKWRAINLFFSLIVGINLLNLPTSVWALGRDLPFLPVLPALTIAATAGFLFVFWLMTSRPTVVETDEEYLSQGRGFGRLALGYGACGLLIIAVFRLPLINLNDADGRKGDFCDRCAHEILTLSEGSSCLVTDGLLDLNLFVAKKTLRSSVTLLSLSPDALRGADAQRAVSGNRRLAKPTSATSEEDIKAFLVDWMRANPGSHAQLSFFCPVAFLQQSGIPTPPNGLCYTGLVPEPSADIVRKTFEKNQACWRRLQPMLRADRTLSPGLRQRQDALREFAGRVANDMGVYLQQAGLHAEAEASFIDAQRFDPANLTAMLNQYGLRIRHPDIGRPGECAARIGKLAAAPAFFDAFDQRTASGGILIAQEADAVLPALLADTPIGKAPPAHILTLASCWLGRGQVKTTPSVPERPTVQANGAPPLARAIAARASGLNTHSENLLRRIVSEKPNNLEAWSLLAEIAFAKNAVGDVEQKILPAMLAAEGSARSPLPDMVQGNALLRAKPPRHQEAAVCFRRALRLAPTLQTAADQLLHASLACGSPQQVETDAQTVLATLPSNVLAHALLGSLKLRQRDFDGAESHLRTSLATQPTAGACNDLAELCRLKGRATDADAFVRKAIRLDPGLSQAWNTLGCLMADLGNLKEADAAFQCQTKLNPSSSDGYLALAGVWERQGRIDEAQRLIQFVSQRFAQHSTKVQTSKDGTPDSGL